MSQANPVKHSKSGILLLEKPRDMTSFGVVSRLRRLVGERKIGHTGTLDPFAEGLLAICVGRATSVVQFMDAYDKTYRVRICFGQATDTMDLTGTVLEQHLFTEAELAAQQACDFAPLRQAVAALPGQVMQLPPMYSAVKMDGQPLYKLARSGQTIERQPRPITIFSAELDQVICRTASEPDGPYLAADVTLKVSKGTYIRVIADELGRTLGWYAHAERLERLAVGPFNRDQAITLMQLEALFETVAERPAAQDHVWEQLAATGQVHSLAEALAHLPVLQLPQQLALRLTQGQRLVLDLMALADLALPPKILDKSQQLALYSPKGLLGVGHLEPESETPKTTYRLVTERIFLTHEDLLSN